MGDSHIDNPMFMEEVAIQMARLRKLGVYAWDKHTYGGVYAESVATYQARRIAENKLYSSKGSDTTGEDRSPEGRALDPHNKG